MESWHFVLHLPLRHQVPHHPLHLPLASLSFWRHFLIELVGEVTVLVLGALGAKIEFFSVRAGALKERQARASVEVRGGRAEDAASSKGTVRVEKP